MKAHIGDERVVATAEGNGPVNALDAALRLAIEPYFEKLRNVHLTDYRVRVLDTSKGTGAVTRVLLDTADAESNWSTIGVSENIIEASWEALVDSVVFGLIRAGPATPGRKRRRKCRDPAEVRSHHGATRGPRGAADRASRSLDDPSPGGEPSRTAVATQTRPRCSRT